MLRLLISKKFAVSAGSTASRRVLPKIGKVPSTMACFHTNAIRYNKDRASTEGSSFFGEGKRNSEYNSGSFSTKNAKYLSLFAALGAAYFISPYRISLKNKKKKEEKEKELNSSPETNSNGDTGMKAVEQDLIAISNSDESSTTVTADGSVETPEAGKLADTEEEVNKEGAYNPETGEINWDCPCLGGMADGPCGEEFKEAFSCFIYSEADPKGIDCVEKFQNMQTCFRKYPEHYAEQLKDEDEVNQRLEAENGEMEADSEMKEVNDSTGEASKGNTELLDITEPLPEPQELDPVEEIELTESD